MSMWNISEQRIFKILFWYFYIIDCLKTAISDRCIGIDNPGSIHIKCHIMKTFLQIVKNSSPVSLMLHRSTKFQLSTVENIYFNLICSRRIQIKFYRIFIQHMNTSGHIYISPRRISLLIHIKSYHFINRVKEHHAFFHCLPIKYI